MAANFAANAQIEVCGGERNLILFRLDEDIAQNGHGGFGADHVEHLSKAVGEVIAIDFEFHEGGGGTRV